MTRVILRPGPPGEGGLNIGLTLPPAAPPPASAEPCTPVAPIADWVDITTVMPCATEFNLATITAGVFLATVNPADTSSQYGWTVDTTGVTTPYLCLVQPTDAPVMGANFRFFGYGSQYMLDGAGAAMSYFFLVRPGDGIVSLASYQRSTSFGDTSNGILADVSFTCVCLAIDPPA